MRLLCVKLTWWNSTGVWISMIHVRFYRKEKDKQRLVTCDLWFSCFVVVEDLLLLLSHQFVLQCECDYRFRLAYCIITLLAIPEVCLIPDSALSLTSRILKEMNLFFSFGFMLSLLNIVLCKRFEVNQIKCLGKCDRILWLTWLI